MPQMSPINWLFLFIIFTMIFILFNMMNYYSILPKTSESKTSKTISSNSLSWKWLQIYSLYLTPHLVS